jgi:hypothetical protein
MKHDCCCGLFSYYEDEPLLIKNQDSVELILQRLRTRLRHSLVQCDQYETQLRESAGNESEQRKAAQSLVKATKIKNRADELLRLVEEAVRTYEAAHEMHQTAHTLSDIMSAIPQDALDELRDVSDRVQESSTQLIMPVEEEEEQQSFELPNVVPKKEKIVAINVN